MTTIPDEALERRRVQNRIAQRRFRQRKQDYQSTTEIDGQLQNKVSSLYPEPTDIDAHFDNFAPSPSDGPPLSVGFPTLPRRKSSSYAQHSRPGSNSNLGPTDLYSSFPQCDPTALTHRRPTSHPPTESMALDDIFGPPLGGGSGGESPAARSESIHRLFDDRSIATTRPAMTGQTEPPVDLSPLWHYSVSTAIDTPNTGTDPRTRPGSSCSSSGWMNPLHMAAQRGHSGIVRVLLKQNMDPNERDSDGLTSIMHAVAAGYDDVASLLLAHGARLSEVDNRRRSALHWAVLKNREAALRLLLKHAANDHSLIDGYDDAGRTPLHTAIELGSESFVAILLESGANMHSRARKP